MDIVPFLNHLAQTQRFLHHLLWGKQSSLLPDTTALVGRQIKCAFHIQGTVSLCCSDKGLCLKLASYILASLVCPATPIHQVFSTQLCHLVVLLWMGHFFMKKGTVWVAKGRAFYDQIMVYLDHDKHPHIPPPVYTDGIQLELRFLNIFPGHFPTAGGGTFIPVHLRPKSVKSWKISKKETDC